MTVTCRAEVVSADAFTTAKRSFEQTFYNSDPVNKIALRNQAILQLMGNPDHMQDPRFTTLMYGVIDKAETWYDVGLAFQFWTRASGPARDKLAADLGDVNSGLSRRVREAIAFMIADYGRYSSEVSTEERAAILKALDDKQPGVRRYCALACQALPDGEVLEALLFQWSEEKDEGVISYILDSLRQITGKTELARDLAEWQSWRKGNPDAELERGFREPEWVPGMYGELELQFVESTGAGRPIWVLPPYGLENSLYLPGLSVLESIGTLTYIKLPTVGDAIEIELDEEGNELYPVDALVASLEVLREERKEPKIVLLGCLDAGLILMRYAQLHPDRVAALILVSSWTSDEAYVASLETLKLRGTEEERLFTRVALRDPDLANLGESESFSVKIGRLASVLDDPADVYGCQIWEKFYDLRATRSLLVPRTRLDKRDKIQVPVLFVHGARDEMNSAKSTDFDGKVFFKPRPKVVEVDDCGPLPWHDAPGEFRDEVQKFLKKVK